jgi:hypothetical protein
VCSCIRGVDMACDGVEIVCTRKWTREHKIVKIWHGTTQAEVTAHHSNSDEDFNIEFDPVFDYENGCECPDTCTMLILEEDRGQIRVVGAPTVEVINFSEGTSPMIIEIYTYKFSREDTLKIRCVAQGETFAIKMPDSGDMDEALAMLSVQAKKGLSSKA